MRSTAERSVVCVDPARSGSISSRLPARGRVEDEDVFPLPEPERVDVAERPPQLVPEIVQQAARRAERLAEGAVLARGGQETEAVERRGLEVIAQRVLRGLGGETPGIVLDEKIGKRLGIAVGERRGLEVDLVALGDDDLCRVEPAQRIAERFRRRKFAGEEFARRQVKRGNAVDNGLRRIALRMPRWRHGSEEIILLRLELPRRRGCSPA